MEQLFAVRVLVHYYDKPKVDHAAVRRLLSAAQIDSLRLLTTEGTFLPLSDYMTKEKDTRKVVSEVMGSCGSSLVQVASVFMLAEARAAADAVGTNSNDLETACSALERLLGCVATQRPLLPQRDIRQSAKVRLGTAARRRALRRLSNSSYPNNNHVSILKAVNAVLRLCDVATHCLAVVSRQSLSRKSACGTAVNLSTRLLTLAASLYEVQRTGTAPALSFFSSNSLRTALVTGAMHLGAITIEHSDIEPMTWIHVANRILMRNSTPAPHRTSVLSALFGGMIRAGKRYQASDRDTRAAEGAVCLLSTLHIVLEADIMEDARERLEEDRLTSTMVSTTSDRSEDTSSKASSFSSAPVSQAARSFLGERVIAAEEDGDEGRIAARTAYQACEEYAERAGETKGMVDFLVELFATAARQCRQECSEEPVVSISEGTLPCPPDESDASSDGPQARCDTQQFSIDVFDNKSRDGLGTGPTGGSNSEMSMEQIERIELHREIGSLALECLAHWLNMSQADHRYPNFNVTEFGIRICRSASLFIMSNSSASYDLKSAMVDFGALIGPILGQRIEGLPGEQRRVEWNKLVTNLIEVCYRTNPVLSGIICQSAGDGVLCPLLEAFLSSRDESDPPEESTSDETTRLPTESILELLLCTICRSNAMLVVEKVSHSLREASCAEVNSASLIYCTSCLILLSHAVHVMLETDGPHGRARLALAALYHRDAEFVIDPALPDVTVESEPERAHQLSQRADRAEAAILVSNLIDVPDVIGRICAHSTILLRRNPNNAAGRSYEIVVADYPAGSGSLEKLCYHFFWSCLMVEDVLRVLKTVTQSEPCPSWEKKDILCDLPLSGPYICAKAYFSATFRRQLAKELQDRREGSFPMLYVAECNALFHADTAAYADTDILELLLASIVNNVMDLLSNSFYKDISKNYKTLHHAFLRDPLQEVNRPETHHSDIRLKTFKERLKATAEGSCLSLAMHYMRCIGSGNVPDLLADVLMSATQLLHCLNEEELVRARQWILEVSKHLLFLPGSLSRLRGAMCCLVETYLSLSLQVPPGTLFENGSLLLFIGRVCGFSYLLERTSSSAHEIQAFCDFAHDTSTNDDVDMEALRKCLDSGFTFKDKRRKLRDFVTNTLPTVTLSAILERILVPCDESAVAVSTHSQSLSLLTRACEASDLWKSSTICSLGHLFTMDGKDVVSHMIRRSVMQSATMNEGVLSIFERVIGASDSRIGGQILVTAFRAARSQLEKDLDATVESRIRLLNFAVRTAVSHGYVLNRLAAESGDEEDFLGSELISLLFMSLHKTTEKALIGTKDKISEQMILFLCSLIDCVNESLHGRAESFFDHVGVSSSQRTLAQKSDSDNELSTEASSKSTGMHMLPKQTEDSSSQDREDPSQSSLCTYTSTGSQFVKQHWYFCYSCELAGTEGVCSICARVCHRDCELAYSKFSRFFCDCGAGADAREEVGSQAVASSEDGEGVNANASEIHGTQVKSRKPCLCLNSKKDETTDRMAIDNVRQRDRSLSSFQHDRDKILAVQLRDLLSSELEAISTGDLRLRQKQRNVIEEALKSQLSSSRTTQDLTATALFLTKKLGGCHITKGAKSTWVSLSLLSAEVERKRDASNLGIAATSTTIATLAKVLKTSSYEINGPSAETKACQGSLISYSPHEGIVAIVDKSGCVNFVDALSLLMKGSASEKKASHSHLRVRVSKSIWDIQFHPGNSNLLLAVGNESVSILCRLSERGGSYWHNVDVEIGMSEYEGFDGNNALVRASWVNEKSTLLLVLTEQFVKIFDVAVDTFCPCFFSKVPTGTSHPSPSSSGGSAASADEENSNRKPVLIGATVFVEDVQQEGTSGFYVFLLTSLGDVFLSKSRRNDASPPVFSYCFSTVQVFGGVVAQYAIQGICDSYSRLMLIITSANGCMLCASIALRDLDGELQCTIPWLHICNDAFNPGSIPELEHIPGTEMTFLYFQRGQRLEGAGAVSILTDNRIEVQSFGGSPSATVMGLATFGPLSNVREGSGGGGFLVLDDGSLHRVELQRERRCSMSTEVAPLSSVLERQRLRAGKLNQRQRDDRKEYDPVPDLIGFFEKCRVVADHVSTDILDPEAASSPSTARLSAMTMDGSGECMLSPRPNHPFKFAASIENNSIVLVGARLLFGATERSRNRVPGSVKVFDRAVQWKSKNGVKRWLDIPLTVPESTASPQKITFELVPRRFLDEASSNADGLVGFDCLELYAVSSIEFTERKLLHEKRKEKFVEALRDKRGSGGQHMQRQQADLRTSGFRIAGSIAKDAKFSEDQASLLAVVSAISTEKFSSGQQSAELLLELNSQWSSIFEDRLLEEQPFLEHIRKVISALCFDKRESGADGNVVPSDECGVHLMSSGICRLMQDHDEFFNNRGAPPHILSIEKLLFAIGGISRALFQVATKVFPVEREAWIRVHEGAVPHDKDVLRLLQEFLSVRRAGRLLCKSSYGATVNAVDIIMVRGLKQTALQTREGALVSNNDFVTLLVEILCSLDQDRRLETSQRTMDFYDSLDDATELLGSPFEARMATSICEYIEKQRNADQDAPETSMDNGNLTDGSDGTQRWAYRCDSCGEVCDREWWHCNECEDFDLCTKCLRNKSFCPDEPHKADHVLLRGYADEDVDHQMLASESGNQVPDAILSIQETFEPFVNAILQHMEQRDSIDRPWRYIDALEVVSQLLGPSSPCSLREARLKALFLSKFPEAIKSRAEAVGSDLESVLLHRQTSGSGFAQKCDLFVLMLRILLSAPNTSMPSYLHQHNLPRTLFDLLERMHPKLRALARHVSSGNALENPVDVRCDLMARNVWNRNMSDLTYTIMSQRRNTGHVDSLTGTFETLSGSESALAAFLSVMVEIMQVLEYSFKCASNTSITEQMKSVPRNVLCDIINFCEIAGGRGHGTAFKLTASAAKRLLITLSLDNTNTLNHVLDRYLYEEQCSRLSDSLAKAIGRRTTPYDSAVELAGILTTLHKVASCHSETWRAYATANENVLQDIYKAAKSTDSQMQVLALQLLATGVATSPELAEKVIKSLPIVEWNRQGSPLRQEKDAPDSVMPCDDTFGAVLKTNSQFPADLIGAYKQYPQVSNTIFFNEDFEIFQFLVNHILLRSQLKESRIAAGHVIMFGIIKGACEDGGDALTRAVQKALYFGLDCMPYAGDIADSLVICLRFLIYCCHSNVFGAWSGSMLKGFTSRVATHLKERCRFLISHPNARLYGRLSEVIDVSGYYLESDPCLTCAAATWESAEGQERRLDTIRAETKYTATSIMHRLVSTYEVTSITAKIIDPRRTRRAKKVDVFYSSKTVTDAAELKRSDHPWKKLTCLEIDANATECTSDLIVPVAMANIKLAFTEFHELSELSQSTCSESLEQPTPAPLAPTSRHGSTMRTTEALNCPRCSRSVTDRHGICRICHENAYQCRQCRNINYENLDGFLCNECGYCKHGRFEFLISGRPTFVAEPIENEQDRKRASKIIERETSNVHRCIEQLAKLRSSIIRSLISGTPLENAKDQGKLLSMNRVGLADLLDMVAPRSDIAVLEAILEGQGSGQDIEEATTSTQGGVSITEEVIAEGNGNTEISERDQGNRPGSSVTSPVNRIGRIESQRKTHQAESNVISHNTSALAVAYARECRAIFSTMSRSIRVLMLTRAALVRYADTVGSQRRQHAKDFVPDRADKEGNAIHDDVSLESVTKTKKYLNFNTVCCYGCTQSFISKAVNLLQTILKCEGPTQFVFQGADLARDMMLICALCHKQEVRSDIRDLITYLVNDNMRATQLVCSELSKKIGFCIDSYETIDSHSVARFEVSILEATSVLDDSCWEERLKLVIRILFKASHHALTCSSVAESIILPCLRVALQLLKADSELTIIGTSSAVEGSGRALEATNGCASQTQNFDHNENECYEHGIADLPGVLTLTPRGSRSRENSSRQEKTTDECSGLARVQRTDDDNSPVSGFERQGDTMMRVGAGGNANLGKESGLIDQKQSQRAGSSLFSGSGAPSSIGTAADAHVSDDEGIPAEGSDSGIGITDISSVLENEHDAKRVTASVRQWLEGRQSQSAWIASITGKLLEAPGKPRTHETRNLYGDFFILRKFFERWRRSKDCDRRLRPDLNGNVDEQSDKEEHLLIQKDNWIVRLMLFTPCAEVRKEACALLQLLCGEEEMMHLHLLDLLTGLALELGAEVGEKSKEFFDLLERTLEPKTHRLYLMMRGFLPRLAGLIRSRAEELVRCEMEAEASVQLVNFSEGYSMKRLVSLLRQLLDAIPSQRSFLRQRLLERENRALVFPLQRAYICVRKLISMRTRLTDESGSQLSEILLSREFLFTGPTVSAVVSACVSELKAANERNDAQSVALLLEELCSMLCPERQEPTCLLALQKTPTQEEFIRGSMSRNPYLSSSFDGPLMRDVKNKICKDLDLPGLLEDDFAMELLVAGNLVKLDLPIMGVYEHVWRGSTAASVASSMPPAQISRAFGLRRGSQASGSRTNSSGSRSAGLRGTILSFRRMASGRDAQEPDIRADFPTDPPMIVVYRLSGLDGEATEPIIDSLPKESGSETNGEELYKDTMVFGEVGGLSVLLELLAVVGSWGDDAETAIRAPALRLLRCSCEVAKNRALLSKSPGAVGTLLDCAASAFEHAQGSPTAVTSAESLLIAAERILAQQRKEMDAKTPITRNAMCMSSHDPDEVIARVQVFLGRLAVATSPTAEDSILHLLPFLVQGIPKAIDLVLTHLRFSWDALDESEEEQHSVRQLGTVLLATPRDLSGNELAVKAIQAGICEEAVSYVTKRFPVPRRENKATWEVSLQGQAPPLLLRVLTGLSFFLDPSQDQLAAGLMLRNILNRQNEVIPILCQLEMAVSENAVGTSAEEVLEALSRDDSIQRQIEKEREAIKTARREAARASRAAILKEVGLSAEGGGPHAQRQPVNDEAASHSPEAEDSVLKLMAELPDEIGPSCVVCGDGFQCRPEEALSLYVYCRKVSLDITSNLTVSTERAQDSISSARRADWEVWSSGRSRDSNGQSKSGANSCFTTVTHMNAIHLSCHKEAARVDRSSRRDEWDGASLRNSQTKCNNLFPLRPPATLASHKGDEMTSITKLAKTSYTAAIDGYFSRLASLGRTSLSQAKIGMYDLGRSLLRFADGGTTVFSEHSKGGGPHSNACMLPNLVQLLIYLIEFSSLPHNEDPFSGNAVLQTQEAALAKYLFEDEPGDITYYLASSLVLQDLRSWNASIVMFLKRGMMDAVVPLYILLRIVAFSDAVHRCLKKGVLRSNCHWLESFRRHIGMDVTFPVTFGDAINERWEGYLRRVSSREDFVDAIQSNMEMEQVKSEDNEKLIKTIREQFDDESTS